MEDYSEQPSPPSCHYGCGAIAQLRPYGPGGSLVCFPCATATPERNAQAQRAFGAQLDASQAISDIGSAVISAERPVSPLMSGDVELSCTNLTPTEGP